MVCDHPWQETPIGGLVPHYPSFSGNSISKKLLTSQLGVYKKRKKDLKKNLLINFFELKKKKNYCYLLCKYGEIKSFLWK